MFLILVSVCILLLSGMISLCFARHPFRAHVIGVFGVLLGCGTGLIPVAEALWTGQSETMRLAWAVPYGSFFVRLDALSAFFLLPIFGLSAVAALYGAGYLIAHSSHRNIGASWLFFNLLTASMAMVVIACNGILFLLAWEIMSLASFFLVTTENEKPSVRQAGWTYLTATHIGTAFLFVLFLVLGREAGSLDFDHITAAGIYSPSIAGVAFLLAVIGFGTKAGFMPFHVWLPEAHPAAPSHVSALMSGVMIKTGIYGLLRALTFLGRPDQWWGWVLVGIGLISGILGVLYALAQHDLKRLLAYHSVENIGIICLGLGLGVLGMAMNQPILAALGLCGGLLHVLNHALFKGLLFMGAGAVLQATGTRDIDHLGGLIKRMPWTAVMFLTGAVAICGLPPLNGFVSEFLIYIAAFNGIGQPGATVSGMMVIVGLAMIGGLAVACFTKAFGVVFLGEPRSDHAAHVTGDVGWAMRIAMLLLAMGCAVVAILATHAATILEPVISQISGLTGPEVHKLLLVALDPLQSFVRISALLLTVIFLLAWMRRRLLSGRPVIESSTWDCGYGHSTARMQYSASSFAQPLTRMFGVFLRSKHSGTNPHGFFPAHADLRTETKDVFRQNLYEPVFRCVVWLLRQLHWMQHGRIQFYILYIAATLFALLIWNLR
jgi:formate hydrogenlyase subunit 3/multisubunit Na+/H+ antiporter MnhD subunit